jgi:hypothetical protein
MLNVSKGDDVWEQWLPWLRAMDLTRYDAFQASIREWSMVDLQMATFE